MIPGLGEFADGPNGLWYAVEGDAGNAAISGAAMIPFLGNLAGGARILKGLGKLFKSGRAAKPGGKLLWTSWPNYPKVTRGGQEYAKIGNRLYTPHAVERMLPSGIGRPALGKVSGRSISPNYVEHVLRNAKGTRVWGPNGEPRRSFTSGTVQVITEKGIVITVITR